MLENMVIEVTLYIYTLINTQEKVNMQVPYPISDLNKTKQKI